MTWSKTSRIFSRMTQFICLSIHSWLKKTLLASENFQTVLLGVRYVALFVAGPERHLARLPAQNKPLAHCLLRMVTNAPWQIQWNNKIMFMPCKWYKHVKVWEWEKNMFSDCARKGKRKDMKNHCLNRYFSFFLRQRAMDPAPPDSVTKYSVQIGSKLVISVINNHNVIWSLRPEYVTLML